ncbi:chemotaxis protein CheW [bacterium]|nr:chemotaxis protein CheW [bacterium]
MENNLTTELNRNLYLTFILDDATYAVNSDEIIEVIKLPLLEYPYKLPANTVGLLNYNNMLINVIDVRFYLNKKPSSYNKNNSVIIVKTDESIIGIMADRIQGITDFDSANLHNINEFSDNNIVQFIYVKDGNNINILNPYIIENILKHPPVMEEIDISALFPKDETSLSVMENRKQNLADKTKNFLSLDTSLENRYLSFKLNDNIYCIKLSDISEIIKETSFIKLPKISDSFLGITSIRGEYITVLNLKKLLNLKDIHLPPKISSIVIHDKNIKVAAAIDEILEIIDIPEMLLDNTNTKQVSKEIIVNKQIYSLINVENLLNDKRLYVFE